MGQGTKTIFPQLVADALGIPIDDGRDRAAGHRLRPGFRADRRVADRDGRRRAPDQGRADGSVRRWRPRPAARSPRPTATTPDARRAPRRPAVRAVSRASASTTRPTAATPTRPSAGRPAWPASRSTSIPARCTSATWSPPTTSARVIHPVLAEGQVEGGTLQAVGYATIEEIKLRDGRYLNDRLATYIIPTSLDAPRITTILVEAPFDAVPHGAKGVGELPMDVGAPAVIAAIADATGVWIHDLPASPERILAALAGRAGCGAAAARRLGTGAPARAGDDRLSDSRSTRRPSRSTSPGCAGCSTCCARSSP